MAALVSTTHPSTKVHGHEHPPKNIDQYFNVAKKISAVVVIVFALYSDTPLFSAFFVVGGIIGIFDKEKDLDSCKLSGDSCSQGVLEQLAGVKLPKIVELIGGVVVLLFHIDHHPRAFIPLSGLYFGARFSKSFSS